MLEPEEKFVADCLVTFLGDKADVSYVQGDDPPDLLLNVEDQKIGVEVSRIIQPIFDDDKFNVRRSHDETASTIIEKLNSKFGNSIDDSLFLSIGIEMPVNNLRKFKSELDTWVEQFIQNAFDGRREERLIQKADIRITAHTDWGRERKVVGSIHNSKTNPDIGFSVRAPLLERLRDKHEKCKRVDPPIWLALLNEYWIANLDAFQRAAQEIQLKHRFDRVFVVSEGKQVIELQFPSS